MNPLAVEIAKVSLWLTTLRRDRPFTFVDHALRCGDSLLGLTSLDQLEALTLRPEEASSILLEPAREAIRATLDEVREVRERIEATDAVDLREAEGRRPRSRAPSGSSHALQVVGDLVVGAALEEAAGEGKARTIVEASAEEIRDALAAADDDGATRSSRASKRGPAMRSWPARAGRARSAAAVPLGARVPRGLPARERRVRRDRRQPAVPRR